MTEELRLRDQQLVDLTKMMQETLAGLDKSSRKQQDLDALKDQVVEFQTAMDGFKIELKSQQPSDKRVYKAKLKQHKQNLEDMKNQIEWKQTDSVRKDLVGDHQPKVVDYDSGAGLMKHGLEVQQESKDSLARSVQTVHQTLAVGKETANKLDQQTQQMANMIDNLDDIGSTLDRSKKIIRDIARRVATDKYMWVLIVLVFGAIVFIIIYKQLAPRSSTTVGNPSL